MIEQKMLGSVPASPEIFVGRDGTLDEIHARLSAGGNALLLVNGEGGIGKTTIASTYYHRFLDRYSHLIWIVAEKSIEDALLSLALELQLQFDDNCTPAEKVEQTVRELMMLNTPTLLIIDNANDIDSLERVYPQLRKCSNLHLLLTTRITNYALAETCRIDHLNEADARYLFTRYYPHHDSADDVLLSALFEAVGYNTLVIELLAKRLGSVNSDFSKPYPLCALLDYDGGTGTTLRLTYKQAVQFVQYGEIAGNHLKSMGTYQVALLFDRLGAFFTAYGNLDRSLVSYEMYASISRILYDSNPQNVGFKNGLAISYTNLGVFYRDTRKNSNMARKYFIKAKTLFDALAGEFPSYAEFRKNFDWVNRALDYL